MSIYDTLNPEQRQAVFHDKGPLLILAGAGSGKTRVITHRIAHLIQDLDVSPYRILAITFTNKAAKEMRDRVDALVDYGAESIWVSTFHSTCVRILRRFCDRIGFNRNFSIYDTDDQKALIRDIIKRLDLDPKKFRDKSFLSVISAAKNELISPEEFAHAAGRDYIASMQAKVYAEYQEALRANNAFDFDDLLVKTVELFRTSGEALSYYQRRFEYILVDEYQDTNTAQFELIRLLANYTNDDGEIEHNLCVVGDDDQSIYKFRGANIRNILDFERHYQEAMVIKLEQNYRSTGNILAAANEVIAHNLGRKPKALWTQSPEGAPIAYTLFENDREEARTIAGEIGDDVEKGRSRYADHAVLYRTNAQSRVLEEQFIYRGVPYRLVGGVNFYQRKEIKDLMAYLKTIDNGLDGMAVKRILNVPRRGIGQTTIERVEDYAFRSAVSFYDALVCASSVPSVGRALSKIESFVALIEGLRSRLAQPGYSLKELIEDILEATGYREDLRQQEPETAEDRLANIDEFINKAVSFEKDAEDPSLSAFLSEIALVADIDSVDADTDCALLMTLHSAKGLEFDHVYLCGMEEGLFPSCMSLAADDPELELEEERRLCYVGITRAKQTLSLSSAKSRMMRGELQYNHPSRFLNEIPRHLLRKSASGKANDYLNKASSAAAGTDLYTFLNRQKERRQAGNGGYAGNSRTPNGLTASGAMGSSAKAGSGTAGSSARTGSIPAYAAVSSPLPRPLGTDGLGYQVGDTVKHLKFGTGTVTDIRRGGKDFEVTVDFPSGTKRMLASFARLVKIG